MSSSMYATAMPSPTTTTSLTSPATSTAVPTAAAHQHSSAAMSVTFFQSITTPLYSAAWAPSNAGQYAGTCVFLVVLATITRLLIAGRPLLDRRRWKRPSLLASTEKGLFEVLIAGLGYLLMLAVMTMNVGYFCSVLGGVFLGTLVSGNWGSERDEWLPC